MTAADKIRVAWLTGYKSELKEFISARGQGRAPRQTGLTHAREQLEIVETKLEEIER